MASSSACWGIEIGASAIRAIKLEATGDDTVRVADYAVIPHAKPLSMPGVEPNDVLRVSLGALVSQADLSKASIAVAPAGGIAAVGTVSSRSINGVSHPRAGPTVNRNCSDGSLDPRQPASVCLTSARKLRP